VSALSKKDIKSQLRVIKSKFREIFRIAGYKITIASYKVKFDK